MDKNIDYNIEVFENQFNNSFDLMIKRITMPCGKKAAVIAFDGLSNSEVIQDNIIKPLSGQNYGSIEINPSSMQETAERLILSVDIGFSNDFETIFKKCLSGDTAVLIDGFEEAIIAQTRGWPKRGVPMPQSDITIRGSKEAFAESLLVNVTLIRRRIKDPSLKTERISIGTNSNTDVCLMYIEGSADETALGVLRGRLSKIDVSYILDSGQLEQLISDRSNLLFSTLGRSEKPDIVASKILNGKIAIIVDGTPFVLTAPYFFIESFSSADDYYNKALYSNLVRLLRMLSYFVSILLSSVYVALMTSHMELIPSKLLVTLLSSEENVPFGITMEMMLVLILYEILREAVLRLPSQISSTVGIVGGIALGESAISIGLLSAPAVVVLSITYICSAATNSQVESAVILRLAFVIIASIFGLYGIMLGIFMLVIYLCSLTSCSLPYLMPAAPVKKEFISDGIIRGDMRMILKKENRY